MLVDVWDEKKFQFTHPGGVRLTLTSEQAEFVKVSIHAPGRGATRVRRTLGRGLLSFNSRTREGCDKSTIPVTLRRLVSIHAPGRGATTAPTLPPQAHYSFNSRTREGCDRKHFTAIHL